MTRVSTAVSAPIRTGAQLGVGFVLVEFVAAFLATDWTERQYAAALGLATLLVTAAQHLIENRTGHAVLRDVPPTTAPMVDDAGQVDIGGIVVVTLLIFVLLLAFGVLPR